MNTLEVRHISQKGAGADQYANDCGGSCGLMVLKHFGRMKTWTVDDFYMAANPTGEDLFLNMDAIEAVLSKQSILTDRFTWSNIGKLFAELVNGKPCICLVDYATIQDSRLGADDTGFRGAHFVLVDGMNIRGVHVNDPLRSASITWPIEIFKIAWDAVGHQILPNPSNAFISCKAEKITDDGPLANGRILAWSLTLRAGPGSNFPALAYMHQGQDVSILEKKTINNQVWVQVRYQSKSGWCCAISGENKFVYGV